jgi:hypothetical protein
MTIALAGGVAVFSTVWILRWRQTAVRAVKGIGRQAAQVDRFLTSRPSTDQRQSRE